MIVEEHLWPIALSAIIAIVGWFVKTQHDEQKRISILVNKNKVELSEKISNTKIEIAKDYMTHAAFDKFDTKITARFDKIYAKLDKLLERGQ